MIGKRMGGRLGIRCVLIGLLIANGLWVSLIAMEGVPFREALFWYIEFGLHLLVGIAGALWAGYFFGQRAGMAILTKKRNMYLAGITYGWCTLWVGTLSGSAVELITRFNLNHTLWQMGDHYVFKPLYWATLFGLVPVILLGIGFGSKMGSAKESSREEDRRYHP